MNRTAMVSAICLSMLVFGACEAKKSPAVDDVKASTSTGATDPAAVAKDLVTALAAGDTAKASSNFDATMSAQMPPSKLAEVWSQLTAQFGSFKSQLGTRNEKVQGYDVVIVNCEFERGKLDVQVTVDGSGKVSGLFVRPAQA